MIRDCKIRFLDNVYSIYIERLSRKLQELVVPENINFMYLNRRIEELHCDTNEAFSPFAYFLLVAIRLKKTPIVKSIPTLAQNMK